MEAATNSHSPFIGTETIKTDHHLEKCVCTERRRKKGFSSTIKAMLVVGTNGHFQLRYEIVQSACHASTPNAFFQECIRNCHSLKCPEKLMDSTIHNFQQPPDPSQSPSDRPSGSPLGIVFHSQIRNLPKWFFATSTARNINQDCSTTNFQTKKVMDEAKNYGIEASLS